MLQRPFLTFVGVSLAASTAAAQETEATVESPPTVTPVTAIDPSSTPRRAAAEDAPTEELVDLDESPVGQMPAQLDDSIPLPNPAVVDVIDGVDVVTAEASGDPYFLGFAGGKYYPPSDEILDPALVQAAQRPFTDTRPDDETYGFVMFSKRITPERIAALEDLGCHVLGFHPHYTMKVAVPTDRIGDVSVLDFVRWFGVSTPEQKVHPETDDELELLFDGERARLYVSVFESDLNDASTFEEIGRADLMSPDGTSQSIDSNLSGIWRSNGWMQMALEEIGAEIVSYAPRQHTFQILVDPARIDDIVARDFVQFVEPVPQTELNAAPVPHDESTAIIMTDRVRATVDGGTNEVAIVGVVDSGIETAHSDLGIWGVGWNCTTQASAWDDISNGGGGHGTHVAGTILGRGVTDPDHLGNAPGLASWGRDSRVFNYRRFPNPCSVGLDTITSTFGNAYTDTTGETTERPHIINNSWGSTFTSGAQAIGTEFDCRVADDATFDNDQLWVWSAGNSGPNASTLGIQASAKNVFTVGNVVDYVEPTVGDPGELWTTSSRGPAGDDRWKPNGVAPGRLIRSALANNNTGYANYSGTSMAAPHVTAAAAILVDQYAGFRYAPERLMAHLMATAITKDNRSIAVESDTHLDTYGAGRVNIYKAMYNLGGNTWHNRSFQNSGANWFFHDFDVPAGTTRLVVVMSGIEESASAGASAALVNDWDLWIDRDPIDPNGNTGEYFAQQSTRDNSEIRMITNPAPGPWRWKVYPDSVSSSTKLSVTIYWVVDDTTPDGDLTVTASDDCVQPGQPVDVSATVSSDDYIASAVVLDRSGSFNTLLGSSTVLGDGIVTDLTDNASGGNDIVLGDISDFFARTGTWTVSYASEGVKTFTVDSRSDNMVDKNASVQITVDGTDPTLVSNLGSSSHTVGQWSNDPTITWTWNAATDALSGLQGYGIFETTSASPPGNFLDIGPVTSYTSGAYPSSNSGRYFNIRSVDNCDNWDAQFASTGPYLIDVDLPAAPTTVTATTHPVGVARCENSITVRWSGASDAHSGVQAYGTFWSTNPNGTPSNAIDTTNPQESATLSPGTWYLHVKTVDNADNWSTSVAHFGPFIIQSTCGENYCSTGVNSTGAPARIRAVGTDDASQNDFRIEAFQLPPSTVGFFLAAPASGFFAMPPNSQGNICLGGAIGRFQQTVLNSGSGGRFGMQVDLTQVPTPTGTTSITAGTTYFWQAWFRDANPNPTSNLTDGLRVRFY